MRVTLGAFTVARAVPVALALARNELAPGGAVARRVLGEAPSAHPQRSHPQSFCLWLLSPCVADPRGGPSPAER